MCTSNIKPVLYTLNVSDFENGLLYKKAYNLLDCERKEKIDKLRFEKDKRLSLGVGILLKYALYMANISNYEFITGENGKPYLKNSDVFFSLSHSGEMAVCAIASYEVGCDIEKTGKIDLKVAKKFFTDSEYNDIITSDDCCNKFYRYWTLKESFIKATGYGMKIPLNSFALRLNDTVTVKQNLDCNNYYFCEINGIENYCCAVCGLQNCSDIAFCIKTADDVLSEMIYTENLNISEFFKKDLIK